MRKVVIIALMLVAVVMTATIYYIVKRNRLQHDSRSDLGENALILVFDSHPVLVREYKPYKVELYLENGAGKKTELPFPKKPKSPVRIPLADDNAALLCVAVWSSLLSNGKGPSFQGYYELPKRDYSLIYAEISPLGCDKIEVFSRWKSGPFGRIRLRRNLGDEERQLRTLYVVNPPDGVVSTLAEVKWRLLFHPKWPLYLCPETGTVAQFSALTVPHPSTTRLVIRTPANKEYEVLKREAEFTSGWSQWEPGKGRVIKLMRRRDVNPKYLKPVAE